MNTNSRSARGTIYTLGYAHPQAAVALERLMRNPTVLLLDVRYQPVSRWNAQWNRASLTARYGEQYCWEQRLGNSNYWSRERGIQLPGNSQEAVREAATLICAGTSLVLLCACGDERACHRSLIAKLIQDALPVPRAAREVWA
jgi:Domain of unknown function DUF488